MLAAIAAFHDLMQRQYGPAFSLTATAWFVASPLSTFYGRAVIPDTWMLAGMLTSATCYQRHLETGRHRWLLGASAAGLLGALFKYYGLIVLIPLAGMTLRRGGWRLPGLAIPRPGGDDDPAGRGVDGPGLLPHAEPGLIGLGTGTGLPLSPVASARRLAGPARLYRAFFVRFLFYDCGPAMAIPLLVAVAAVVRRSAPYRPPA